jgi:hypothetical protein
MSLTRDTASDDEAGLAKYVAREEYCWLMLSSSALIGSDTKS